MFREVDELAVALIELDDLPVRRQGIVVFQIGHLAF